MYNSEQANTLKERNASQADKDFITAINWKQAEQCVKDGKAKSGPATYAHNWVDEADVARHEMLSGHAGCSIHRLPGLAYFLPTPKSPTRGRRPDRRVHRRRRQARHRDSGPLLFQDAQGDRGQGIRRRTSWIPVLKYEATIAGEVADPGLGPLHTSSTRAALPTPRCS